ncbi:MAG TPA: hypothetical protein VG297_18140 [Bryobacteraceae bacterium]|nr:hypothetical protein [Bryobacteraceae bacterium]
MFLILFLVAVLAGAVSVKADGSRLGEFAQVTESELTKSELTGDVESIRADLHNIGEQIASLPAGMRNLWHDAPRDARVAAVNTFESARDIAYRVVAFIKTS